MRIFSDNEQTREKMEDRLYEEKKKHQEETKRQLFPREQSIPENKHWLCSKFHFTLFHQGIQMKNSNI